MEKNRDEEGRKRRQIKDRKSKEKNRWKREEEKVQRKKEEAIITPIIAEVSESEINAITGKHKRN